MRIIPAISKSDFHFSDLVFHLMVYGCVERNMRGKESLFQSKTETILTFEKYKLSTKGIYNIFVEIYSKETDFESWYKTIRMKTTVYWGAYELTTFARRRRWTAWAAHCVCLSGHLTASRQSRRRCWQRFAGVLEKAGRETNFQSFPYILQRIFPDN